MNNIASNGARLLLITFIAFSGVRVTASQAQTSLRQTSSPLNSDRGGIILFRDADKRCAEYLIQKGDEFYQKNKTLFEKNAKKKAYRSLVKAGKMYAMAAELGNRKALEILMPVADELLRSGCFKDAKGLYIVAARKGSKIAQEKIHYLNSNKKPIERRIGQVFLHFRTLSACKAYFEDIRRNAETWRKNAERKS